MILGGLYPSDLGASGAGFVGVATFLTAIPLNMLAADGFAGAIGGVSGFFPSSFFGPPLKKLNNPDITFLLVKDKDAKMGLVF